MRKHTNMVETQEPMEGQKKKPKAKAKASAEPSECVPPPAGPAEASAAGPSEGPEEAQEAEPVKTVAKNFAKRRRPPTAPFSWRFDAIKAVYFETLGCTFW